MSTPTRSRMVWRSSLRVSRRTALAKVRLSSPITPGTGVGGTMLLMGPPPPMPPVPAARPPAPPAADPASPPPLILPETQARTLAHARPSHREVTSALCRRGRGITPADEKNQGGRGRAAEVAGKDA